MPPLAMISLGTSHVCGISREGDAYCWGDEDQGRLGGGPQTGSHDPVKVASNERFVTLSAGPLHTCALTDQGSTRCWGSNAYGELGNGSGQSAWVPVSVLGQP